MYGKIKHVPNHQPVIVITHFSLASLALAVPIAVLFHDGIDMDV